MGSINQLYLLTISTVLLRGTAIVSLLTLLSRIFGFVRDLLVASLLGASPFADAFFVAFRIPNLLRSFVAEGALTSAFAPVFASALASGKERARQTLKRVTGFLIVTTSIITLGVIIYAPAVVHTLAPGFHSETDKFELCVQLTRVMAPYILCVSLIAMLNAALNALQIFGTSAWAQIIMNIVLIIGALLAIPLSIESATIALSLSVLLGGFVQIISQLPACHRAGLSLKPSFRFFHPDIGEITRLMIPATIGASVYQITIFIATVLASLLPSGSVSWLFYADRVAQFPIGIFSIALASVLLPALANASAKSDRSSFNRNISNSLRYTSFGIIPMAAGIWALSLPITQMLFERGAFTFESSLNTSRAIQALCFGLWASSCHSMLVRAFIARKDSVTPTLIGLIALSVNLSASLLLMGPLAVNDNSNAAVKALAVLQATIISIAPINFNLGHIGLASASAIAAITSLVLVITLFCFKIGGFPWRIFTKSTIRSLLASLGMVWAINQVTTTFQAGATATCIIGTFVGISTYILILLVLRSPELRDTLALARR